MKNFKKSIVLAMAALSAMAFVGCANDGSTATSTETPAATSAPTETPAAE